MIRDFVVYICKITHVKLHKMMKQLIQQLESVKKPHRLNYA